MAAPLPWLVVTTVGSREQAQALARTLVHLRLAACVQIEAITSHYRWEGALHEDGEWRLVCKTVPQAVDGLFALLQAQHPYTLPQLVVQPLQASAAYADWVRQETQGTW